MLAKSQGKLDKAIAKLAADNQSTTNEPSSIPEEAFKIVVDAAKYTLSQSDSRRAVSAASIARKKINAEVHRLQVSCV